MTISESPLAPVWVIGAYTLGSLIFIPITLLIIATAAAFNPVPAFFYAFIGCALSAVVSYWLGRLAGKEFVYRLTGSTLGRIQRQITRHGFLSMLFARVVPLAPFAVVNIIAGATQIRPFDFLLATALGMTPGILGMVILEKEFEGIVSDPAVATVGLLVLLSIFFVGLAVMLSRWYVRKMRHRNLHK